MNKAITLATALSLVAVASWPQSPIPAPTVTTPTTAAPTTMPSTASVPPAITTRVLSQAACRKEITIYIDLSGTMTKQSPNQTNPDRVPLNDIAETLRKFVANDDFIKADDTVTIKYFGTIVKSEAETRDQAAALLAQLADSGRWRGVVNGVTRTDFQVLTDFGKLLFDIRDRIGNATTQRQIIFIASDFAHDQLDRGCDLAYVAVRVAAFRTALLTVLAAFNSAMDPQGQQFGRVQIAGIYAPRGTCIGDNQVSDQVRAALQNVGIRFYRYDEDPTEAAKTLKNYFVGSITARSTDPEGVRVSADKRVRFTLNNPNCDSVEVVGLSFRGDTASKAVTFSAVRAGSGSTDVAVPFDQLSAVWGKDVTVTPVLSAGSTARVAASPLFWLGDWVRITKLAPYLYPWWKWNRGSTLLTATVNQSVQATGSLTIRGIEKEGRDRVFTL